MEEQLEKVRFGSCESLRRAFEFMNLALWIRIDLIKFYFGIFIVCFEFSVLIDKKVSAYKTKRVFRIKSVLVCTC